MRQVHLGICRLYPMMWLVGIGRAMSRLMSSRLIGRTGRFCSASVNGVLSESIARWSLAIEEQAQRVLDQLEGDWQVYFAFFARTGFTDAAQLAGQSIGARMVTLEQLDRDSMPNRWTRAVNRRQDRRGFR